MSLNSVEIGTVYGAILKFRSTLRVVKILKQGNFAYLPLCKMPSEYNGHCYAEGGMHGAAMLPSLLGWDWCDKPDLEQRMESSH